VILVEVQPIGSRPTQIVSPPPHGWPDLRYVYHSDARIDTQIGKVDQTFYDQDSMIRTMELILGLKSLNQFGASSIPVLYALRINQISRLMVLCGALHSQTLNSLPHSHQAFSH
jgi:hypothetical protein